jgi:hypothetical protein
MKLLRAEEEEEEEELPTSSGTIKLAISDRYVYARGILQPSNELLPKKGALLRLADALVDLVPSELNLLKGSVNAHIGCIIRRNER